MRYLFVRTFMAILLVNICHAQDGKFNIVEFYPIENAHSYIGFSIKYMGYAMVRGRFETYRGTFRYDPDNVSKTSVSVSVDVNSIDTDHDWRDKDLKSENWFDVENFPKMHFVSTKAVSTASGFDLIGNLTIKDITKEIVFKMNPASGILKDIRGDFQVILTGEISIDRTDFGVEGKRWSAIKEGITGVANEVRVEISILGKQMNLDNLKNWVSDEKNPIGQIYKIISDQNLENGLKAFEGMKANPDIRLNVRTLDLVGQVLLKEERIAEAISIFKRNLETFPEESLVYDSYAHALAISGNLTDAKTFYQKALEKNPDNQNASEILRYLD